MGDGRLIESPNKQLTASAWSFTNESYFGGKRRYYVFTIEKGPEELVASEIDPWEANSKRTVRRLVIHNSPEGVISWRHEGTVQWAEDSSSITYNLRDTQLTLAVKP